MVWKIMDAEFLANICNRMLRSYDDTPEFQEGLLSRSVDFCTSSFEKVTWFLIMPMDELGWGWAG